MRRRLLNLATVFSALVFAAAVVLWVRSFRVNDSYRFVHAGGNPASARWTAFLAGNAALGLGLSGPGRRPLRLHDADPHLRRLVRGAPLLAHNTACRRAPRLATAPRVAPSPPRAAGPLPFLWV